MRWGVVAVVVLAGTASGCAVFSRRPPPLRPVPGAVQVGVASWYGPGFHGRPTANGETFDQHALTAAHQTLPLGTRVAVTNLANQRSVQVRVNDRGPFIDGRVIDLSYAAARQLDMIGPGTVPVRVEVLGPEDPDEPRPVPVALPPAVLSGVAAPPPDAAKQRPASVYAVQVGAFADYGAARRLQRTLAGRVDGVHLSLVETPRERYYRVRLGPFAGRDAALRAARRVADLGFPAVLLDNAGTQPLARGDRKDGSDR